MRSIKIHIILSLIFLAFTVSAQRKQYKGVYEFSDKIVGNANYFYVQKDSLRIKEGRFTFTSEPVKELGYFSLYEARGEYKNNLRVGNWTFIEYIIELEVSSIRAGNPVVSTIIRKRQLEANYIDGKANGIWTVRKTRRIDRGTEELMASVRINFKDNIPTGKFNYSKKEDNTELNVEAEFNDKGFFNGELIIQVTNLFDLKQLNERRSYKDGFLISLERSINGEKTESVQYTDVVEMMRKIQDSAQITFTKGEKGFPIQFNNAYKEDDIKLNIQNEGNIFISHSLRHFQLNDLALPSLSRPDGLDIKPTARFKFIYPEESDSIINHLNIRLRDFVDKSDELVKDSYVQLNRSFKDTIKLYVLYHNYLKDKYEVFESFYERSLEGEFEYKSREEYLRDKFHFIYSNDTLHYQSNNKKMFMPIGIIDLDSNDIYIDIYNYYNTLIAELNILYKHANTYKTSFETQENLKEINNELVFTLEKIETITSSKAATLRGRNKVSFEKLHESLYLNEYNSYLNNFNSNILSEEKLKLGKDFLNFSNEYLNLMDTLFFVYSVDGKLDTAFTRYTKNPFFDRDVETRIKAGIYRAGVEHLYLSYIKSLSKVKDLNELREIADEVYKFYDRMIELSENNDVEIEKLNRRLRRENVPERIKRFLGLN